MDELIVIKVMNDATLKEIRRSGKSQEENLKIKDYLQDDAYFFKISKEKAFEILLHVGVSQEMLDITYNKLVNSKVFYRLINELKLDINDNNLVIRF